MQPLQLSQPFGNVGMCRATVVLLCIALALFAFPCVKMPKAYAQQPSASQNRANSSPAAFPRYTRTVAHYEVPDVTLMSMDGTKTSFASVLKHDGPIMLQFIFTTCPTICTVMSSILSAAQSDLAKNRSKIINHPDLAVRAAGFKQNKAALATRRDLYAFALLKTIKARNQLARTIGFPATNRDLKREVAEGKFRQDLYYRVNVFPIRSPPCAIAWTTYRFSLMFY